MIVRRNLDPRLTFLYAWKSLVYYMILALGVFFIHTYSESLRVSLPVYTITILSTAIAIFLGFNNNQAYDRWWEARKIWGLLVQLLAGMGSAGHHTLCACGVAGKWRMESATT